MKTSLLALLLLAIPAFADTPAELVQRFDQLTIEPASVRVSGAKLTSGRLQLSLDNGTAARVRAGDEVIGIFFKGNGSFAYVTGDAVEFPAVKTNLKNTKSKASVTASDKTLTVSAPIARFLWLTAGATVPGIGGEAGPSLAAEFEEHLAASRQEIGSQRATRLAVQKLNAAGKPVVRVELAGAEEWVYWRDEGTDFHESLEKLYTLEFENRARRGERYSAVIAQSPLDGNRQKHPQVPAVITHLEYDVTAIEPAVMMVVRETITPLAAGHRALWFALSDTVWDSRDRKRSLTIGKVTTADGKELPFAQTSRQVLVGLPEATVAGKPVQLVFTLSGDVLLRPEGDSYWMLRGAWYPTFEPAGEAFTVKGIVRVKEPFIPFAGGKTLSRRSEDGFNVLESQFDSPIGYVCLIAGKYHFEETKRDKLTVRTASYAQKNAAAIKKLTALAYDMIGYYEYFLGPFPFEELNIIEINDFGWGQAPAGLIFITSEAFQPLLGTMNQLYSQGINERIAHEIAHQYWGSAVKMPSFEEQWLSESFAEYSAALMLKKGQGDAVYKRLVAHWRGNANVARDSAPIPLANRLVQPNDFEFNRVHLLYSKGPLLLAALHKELGDEVFMTFLKSYQKSFRNKFGSTRDVVGLLSFMTKKDYKPFFDNYYWGTAVPN